MIKQSTKERINAACSCMYLDIGEGIISNE